MCNVTMIAWGYGVLNLVLVGMYNWEFKSGPK